MDNATSPADLSHRSTSEHQANTHLCSGLTPILIDAAYGAKADTVRKHISTHLSRADTDRLSAACNAAKPSKRALHDLQFAMLPETCFPWGNSALHLQPPALEHHSNQLDLTHSMVVYYADNKTPGPDNLAAIRRIVVVLTQDALTAVLEAPLFATLTEARSLHHQPVAANSPWQVLDIHPTAEYCYEVISVLFNSLVVTGKPVMHYGCNFYIPLDLFLEEELQSHCEDLLCLRQSPIASYLYSSTDNRPTEDARASEHSQSGTGTPPPPTENKKRANDTQTFFYFTAHLRRYLFETGTKIDRKFRVEPIKEFHWQPPEPIFLATGVNQQTQHPCDQSVLCTGNPGTPSHDSNTVDNTNTDTTPTTVTRYPLTNIQAQVDTVRLYRYFNQLYILDIQVSNTADTHVKKDDTPPSWQNNGDHWWHDLLFGQEELFVAAQAQQLEVWLRYTQTVRRLYPSFMEQADEKKIDRINLLSSEGQPLLASCRHPLKASKIHIEPSDELNNHISEAIAPYILFLLEQFFVPASDSLQSRWKRYWAGLPGTIIPSQQQSVTPLLKPRLKYIEDDRAFVSVRYALCGPAPQTAREKDNHQRLFSYALYVDTGADGFPALGGYCYDPDFLSNLTCQNQYRRWDASGSYYGYTNFSNVALGYNSYFNTTIAREDIPRVYNRMLVSALFYRLSLTHYNRRVTYATNMIKNRSWRIFRNPFNRLRRDYIEFTNKYWFTELTHQTQGQEIFRHQMDALKITELYKEIKEEMHWAHEYLSSRTTYWLTIFGVIIAGASLLPGLVSAYPVILDLFSLKQTPDSAVTAQHASSHDINKDLSTLPVQATEKTKIHPPSLCTHNTVSPVAAPTTKP